MNTLGNMLLATSEAATWDQSVSPNGKHILWHGDACSSTVMFTERCNIAFIDAPAVGENMKLAECEAFFQSFVLWLNRNMASNAAAIVVGRERKGHPYLKHVILAGLLQRSNWKVFREYIWNWSKSNYNRAQYCFHPAYVFRRGNMPTVKLSKARYKDIIFVPRPKHKDLHTPDVQSMPVELVEILVSLFVKDPKQINVLDPFAGSAVVACAAENLGCRSVSVELQRARFEELSLAIWPKLTKL